MTAPGATVTQHPGAWGLGLEIGVIPPGKWNAITDLPGVKVGQVTLVEGDSVRTGVTAKGRDGQVVEALPIDKLLPIFRKYNRIK